MRVCRQETTITVSQCFLPPSGLPLPPTPGSRGLVRTLFPLCAGGMVTGSCQKAWRKCGATSLWSHGSLPLGLYTQSVCPRHRAFVLSKCKSISGNHVDPQQTPLPRVKLPSLTCGLVHTLCRVHVFDYRLFGMEGSQGVLCCSS